MPKPVICLMAVLSVVGFGCKKESPKAPKNPVQTTVSSAAHSGLNTSSDAAPPPPPVVPTTATPPAPSALATAAGGAGGGINGVIKQTDDEGNALDGMAIIKKAIMSHVEGFRLPYPTRVEELVEKGTLKTLPPAPEGKKWAIDPATKQVILK